MRVLGRTVCRGIDIVLRSASEGVVARYEAGFVATIVDAFLGATVDQMILDPGLAMSYCVVSFEALWKVLLKGSWPHVVPRYMRYRGAHASVSS